MTTATEYSSSLAQSAALTAEIDNLIRLTNTTLEGMAGVFAPAVRDAIYRGISS